MGQRINHILMYRFKEGVPESRIDEHLAFIESMRDQVDGLTELKFGRDLGDGTRKYTHGFVMTFESAESLASYNKCEIHRELVDIFRDDVEDKVVFDFEAS